MLALTTVTHCTTCNSLDQNVTYVNIEALYDECESRKQQFYISIYYIDNGFKKAHTQSSQPACSCKTHAYSGNRGETVLKTHLLKVVHVG